METCQICYGEVDKLRVSPTKCKDREGRSIEHKKKCERACGECWEVHLSNEVEEKPAEEIECLFCYTKLSEDQVKSLAWAGTYRRYKWKTEDRHFQRCQDRCAASRILDREGKPVRNSEAEGFSFKFKPQEHDRETAGKLFACGDCGFESCNRFVGQREAWNARMEQRKQNRPKKAAKRKNEDDEGVKSGNDKRDDRPGPQQQTKRRKRSAETSTQDARKAKQSKRSKA
ncbi:hypothetical protein KC343_g6562 [Hortaea werneckii]|nr:hypothetical protein KC352_g12383 [Hortaea werneckii]KAI7566052.1 hypothetical protein KC317_g5927 [Hortaea werneckii]KAI7618975.1 hypothetical protein KC346_g4761 [Hortaea werneckii]KAI7625673.1 hypothetical protein KC343_g6562 [Hortaea werneckii]KAI7672337.1 hypothetical protein KC319_g5341 [Hortaea werneckii]